MKDKHPAKVKLARKLILPIEIKFHVSLFNSYGWNQRKLKIEQEVRDREAKQKENK